MFRNPILAVGFSFVIASGAQAARLSEVEGTVLVNKGDGFWEVNGATIVSAGDRVLIRGKGRAQIDYGDGCVKRIVNNQTAVVAAKPNCDSIALPTHKPQIAPKAAVAMKGGPAAPVVEQAGTDNPALIIGGVVAVASAVAAISSQGGDSKSEGGKGDKSEGGKGDKSSPDAPIFDAVASSAAAIPGNSEKPEAQVSNIAVVDNLVIAKSDAAAVALEGIDNKDGSPASP